MADKMELKSRQWSCSSLENLAVSMKLPDSKEELQRLAQEPTGSPILQGQNQIELCLFGCYCIFFDMTDGPFQLGYSYNLNHC